MAISLCTANTSLSSRSYVSVHNSRPSAALISSATIRTRSPCLRTLPSSRFITPSFLPIARLSSEVPFKRNEELRLIILSAGTLARTAISSSDSPSEKYSLLGSPPVLTNGSTARLFSATLEIDGAGRRETSKKAATVAATKRSAAAAIPQRTPARRLRRVRNFFGIWEFPTASL